ncbi:MAG: sodium-dependent bicarbonate transport family permease [Trueperaceae bacterium]
MDTLELLRLNLFSPVVLAFALGIVATLVKSDLKLPAELYTTLSIYLLLAIGLKGGVELSQTPFSIFWKSALATLVLGCVIPFWSYFVARKFGGLDVANAAALAAHYGSVSAVTFIAVQNFLSNAGASFEGFMPTLVALLEIPAILIALVIANRSLAKETGEGAPWGEVLHEILAGRSILLLVGGVLMGLLAGKEGFEPVAPFFADPFRGALTLFLLELGMVTAKRFADLRKAGRFLLAFGIFMPILHGVIGLFAGKFAGLSMGGATILAVLAASASYIAAPAAVRIALPQANPSYYLTASLAITFPFNLTIGIPLMYELAKRIYGV